MQVICERSLRRKERNAKQNMEIGKFENKRSEISTRKSRELSEVMREHLVLFGTVKNKVAFVNPGLNLPFKIEKMGLFAKASYLKKYPVESGEHPLETLPEHHRSALLGRVIFKDKEGRLYRDVDIKGIGHIREGEVRRPGESRGTQDEYYGMLEDKTAFDEHKVQEELLKEGIRTIRTLAIINLEEIIFEGKKVSLEEARKKGIIEKEFQPVIAVRAFGTKVRISDVFFRTRTINKKTQDIILEDAKKLVSQEIGKDLSDNKDYLEWFAETLGQNVGNLHKKDWLHRGIHKHNITLDCRLADFDTAIKIDKSYEDTGSGYQRDRDMHDAASSLENLISSLGLKDEIYIFSKRFYQSYNNVFHAK